MKNELVSIIMPAFNASQFISDSIDGILMQSYKNFELIVCDDFSSDNTKEIVSKYLIKDSRIKFFSNDKNYGIASTRNKCLENAKGSLVAFCDSDDIWNANKLMLQIQKLKEGKYHIVSSNCNVINESGEIIGNRSYPKNITSKMMRYRNYVINSSAVFKRDIHDCLFSNIKHEDYLFWLKISKYTNIYCMQLPLINYRVHKNNFTSNKFKSFFWQFYVWRRAGESIYMIPILFFLNLFTRYIYEVHK